MLERSELHLDADPSKTMIYSSHARVAKLVDALALGASGATHEGSSPFPGTKAHKRPD